LFPGSIIIDFILNIKYDLLFIAVTSVIFVFCVSLVIKNFVSRMTMYKNKF